MASFHGLIIIKLNEGVDVSKKGVKCEEVDISETVRTSTLTL